MRRKGRVAGGGRRKGKDRKAKQGGGIKKRKEKKMELGRKRNGRIYVEEKNLGGKKEVIRKRVELKGRKERIENDWTKEERKMQWKLEELAREKRRRGKNAVLCKTMDGGKVVEMGCGNGGTREKRRTREERKGGGEEGRRGGFYGKKDKRKQGEIGGRSREKEKEMEEKRKKGEGAIGRNELREKGKGLRIDFLNVAGVKGKNEQFWERIREWDVVG